MAAGATTPRDSAAGRLVSLDILRAVAVLLVIGRHMDPPRADSAAVQTVLVGWLQGGWIGVDLFFVLSGFLISGLLFREYSERGNLRIGRFLVRRGLKIYPPFYALLLYTLVVGYLRGMGFPPMRPFMGELLYLQNYLGGLWNHTWSLAVEEHFYLLFPLLLLGLLKFTKEGEPAFKGLPGIAVLVLATCLLLRLLTAAWNPGYTHLGQLFPTHLRIDGLMFGVLISWGYHLHPERFRARARKIGEVRLLLYGLVLLLPNFLFTLGRVEYIHTLGLTANLVGSGAILVAGLLWEERKARRRGVLAYVGYYSYSIYLWHMPVAVHLMPWLGVPAVLPRGSVAAFVLYAATSCVAGVLMAKLIEFPVLRLRDRLFPSRSKPIQLLGVSGWDRMAPLPLSGSGRSRSTRPAPP